MPKQETKTIKKTKTKTMAAKKVEKPLKSVAEKKVKTAKKELVKKEANVKAALHEKEAKESSISVSFYGLDGKIAGKISLPGEIFAAKVNPTLMAQAVRVYLSNQRTGTSSTKTRSEVAGTTKKMYRQKGTGRARHGAAKAPIFVGGGITFGPKPRDFSLDLPKKMKRRALFSALTEKLLENNVKVLDTASVTGKTREMAEALKNLNIAGKVMVVVDSKGKLTAQATRNIKGVTVQNASNLTTYEVLSAKTILFSKTSIDALKNTFLKELESQRDIVRKV